jgi:hypothetical protein
VEARRLAVEPKRRAEQTIHVVNVPGVGYAKRSLRRQQMVSAPRSSQSAKSVARPRAPQKHSTPQLERQESGASVGAVFIRSFGVWFLYEIRRYKSIEKCRGRSVAALRERNLKSKWIHELRPVDIA